MLVRIAMLIAMVAGSIAFAKESKTAQRLEEAATVISEIMDTPDKGIPQDLLDGAQCIIVVP